MRRPTFPARLAARLYRPSYLSGLWALGFYDMIPERVVWLTSVTTRGPRRFENPFGVFDYRHLKREAFFGYSRVTHGTEAVLVAEPEKALLDHWHLTPPTEKLAARFPRTMANLARALAEVPHVLVYDNDDLARPYRWCAEFAAGRVVTREKRWPRWLQIAAGGRR